MQAHECSPRWAKRCAESPSNRCTCACQGKNHGREAKQVFHRGRKVPRRARQADFIDDLFTDQPGEVEPQE